MRPLFVFIGEGAIIHPTPSHPMTAYLPGYTYLFASTVRQEDAPYFIRLRKTYIRAVLQDLHELFHHVYVLLENLPENRFAIIRYHNHAGSLIRPGSTIADDRFTLRQFREHIDLLHEQDRFRVHFFTEVFYYEQGFTPQTIERLYRHYLKHLCASGLRENKPLQLTESNVSEYGLTKLDAVLVRDQLQEYTADTLQDMQVEYRALSALDCIKNESDE